MKVESAHGLKVQEEQDIDLIKIILKPRSSVNMCVCVCVLEAVLWQSLDVHSQHLIRRLIKRTLGTK